MAKKSKWFKKILFLYRVLTILCHQLHVKRPLEVTSGHKKVNTRYLQINVYSSSMFIVHGVISGSIGVKCVSSNVRSFEVGMDIEMVVNGILMVFPLSCIFINSSTSVTFLYLLYKIFRSSFSSSCWIHYQIFFARRRILRIQN